MKPVQLMPDAVVVKAAKAPSSASSIAIIVGGGLLVMGIGGYFGWATISELNEKTMQVQQETTALDAKALDLQSQIAEANTKSDYGPTAERFQSELVSRLEARIDYAMLSRELQNVMPPGAWLTTLRATVPQDGGGDVDGITIQGYAPSYEDVGRLVTNLNATDTIAKAHVTETSDAESADGRSFIEFTLSARFVASAGAGGVSTDPNAVMVSDGDDAARELALEPEPGYDRKQQAAKKKQAKKKKPAPQLTSLEKVANAADGYGGGS